MNNYITFPGADCRAWFFIPAVSSAAASVASRTTAGILGLGAKALSNVTNKFDLENLGNKLISYAIKNPKSEIAAIFYWTVLGGTAYGITEFSENPNGGIYTLLPESLQTVPWEKVTSFISENSNIAGTFFAGAHLLSNSTSADPEWVKNKFDLAVSNIFNVLSEKNISLDFAEDSDLACLVKKIIEDNKKENDPRSNHAIFISNLRNALNSPAFKEAFVNKKLNNNQNSPVQNQLVDLLIEMCRIRFEEGYFYDFFTQTMDELGLSKDKGGILTNEDFKILDHLKPEHQMSSIGVMIGKAQGHLNIGFDPNSKDNIPYVIGTLNVAGREIKLIRVGSPTIEGYVERAKIIPEFKGYLEFLLSQDKNYLYISLQNDQPKYPGNGDETGRNRAIKDLQSEFNNFFAVVLAQDSRFYKQLDKQKKPLGPQQSDEFLKNFYDEMMGEGTGFYFPEAWKNDPVFQQNINELLSFVHRVIFNENDYKSIELSRAQRLDFIEIFYTYLSLYLMHYCKADCANGSCKDAIDRGGKLNSLILQLLLTMGGKAKEPSYQRIHQVYTHMPAMWTKGRAILPGRRDRLITAFDRMSDKMSRIEENKINAFDQITQSNISLIDSKNAMQFRL